MPAQPLPFAALRAETDVPRSTLRDAISQACRREEQAAVQALLAEAGSAAAVRDEARPLALDLVRAVRAERSKASGVDALMHEFSLSSEEGVALMCLAEALLRIPDAGTADRLIADKISRGDWARHLGESPSLFVNAATWGLLVTGKLVGSASERGLGAALTRLIAKGGEPLIRKAVDLAMRMLGSQFVTGQTIDEALLNSRAAEQRGYRYSYDMLGEAALTADDAARYLLAYEEAIHAIGEVAAGRGIHRGPGISVKLSALHPRYVRSQRERVMQELLPRLRRLALLAKSYDIGLNIDAEEADRLEMSLDLMEALAHDGALAGFDGLGFVVQAYQKRCPHVIEFLADLARRTDRRFMVRLVKGAYWDSEIKRAQVDGLPGYPVYTRKLYTDVSYLVCAGKLLSHAERLYPQFATHNAHTLASVYHMARAANVTGYEFQCLHGMGETLYDHVVGEEGLNVPCRIYAPVGSHQTLLAYLVRRLLENGANTSFVNQIVDDRISLESLVADPLEAARALAGAPHPAIPLPTDMFGNQRRNSIGLDQWSEAGLRATASDLESWADVRWHAAPLLATATEPTDARVVRNPADSRDAVGEVRDAGPAEVELALAESLKAGGHWARTPAAQRARLLARAAELLEQNRPELLALLMREAGKTLSNAVAEVREAVDFLRYYGNQVAASAPGAPLGPVTCISPWNFPLAIFVGQISAALAAGNPVLAKPAEQTPLIAFRAVQLLHQAGIPRAVLQLLPGPGDRVGAALTADSRVAAVIFTGSTEVARLIQHTLLARSAIERRDIPLVAETGGQNALIVDSSALTEQVVQDALASAFDSAGQRCSALRVLCLQEEIADRTLDMLRGAMQELRIGNPDRLATDVGPVIDQEARGQLEAHIERMIVSGRTCHRLPLTDQCADGFFVAPAVIEIAALSELQREVFGPVLHVLRYRREQLPELLQDLHHTGYGLTLGIHSRIDETIDAICRDAHVGNIYVNRNIVGAVVGVQPFGGEGKSGTGPKAGGPLYLKRLQQPDSAPPVFFDAAHDMGPRASTLASLEALQDWADRNGKEALAIHCEHYARGTLLGRVLNLPGPTGERNTLRFAERGVVLSLATAEAEVLNHLAGAAATGNKLAVSPHWVRRLARDLPPPLRELVTEDRGQASAVLVDVASEPGWVDHVIALCDTRGMVMPVVHVPGSGEVPLWRLLAERAVCVNTTAAGGNASLMTMSAT
jgi:RHH-type proline utilization regulon transcriptional repressor/proline dehydrogenase/delta 1-pyrroline-5-carboxylate dehydrogenase